MDLEERHVAQSGICLQIGQQHRYVQLVYELNVDGGPFRGVLAFRVEVLVLGVHCRKVGEIGVTHDPDQAVNTGFFLMAAVVKIRQVAALHLTNVLASLHVSNPVPHRRATLARP